MWQPHQLHRILKINLYCANRYVMQCEQCQGSATTSTPAAVCFYGQLLHSQMSFRLLLF